MIFQDIINYKPLTKIPEKVIQKTAIENDSLKTEDDNIYNIVVIDCKEGNEEALAKKLLKTNLFEYVSPDYKLYLDTPPNDNAYYLQRGLDQANDIDIDIEDAWLTNTGSSNVKVAILDTGIDFNNDDLGNGTWNVAGAKVRAGYNYYDGNSNPLDNDITSSHGTSVGGIIGAYRNNNNRVAGIAGGDASIGNPGVTLYALKVFSGSDGTSRATGSSSAMAAALIDAAKPESEGGFGCQIANYSGGQLASSNNAFIEMFLPGNPAYDAMRYAARHNLLFVASKGNDNTNALHYPSDLKENWALSVGASNGTDQRALYGNGQGSNWGNNIDVVAPGTTDLVYTTRRVASGSEGTFSGTSAAAPVVAGVAALLKSQNMALHRDDLEQLIKMSAAKIRTDIYTYTNGYNEQMGFGKVNAANAMAYLKAPYQLVQNSITGGTIEDISSSQWFTLISGSELAAGNYYGKRYRVKTTIQKPFCSGENYIWPRIEGASKGWSGANPNNQENYIYRNNETSTSVDFTTWVYYIQYNIAGQTINNWYPCAPQNVKFAYTALGLSDYYKPDLQISGPSQICFNAQATYSVPSVGGATYSWNIPYNFSVVGPSNASQITLQEDLNESTTEGNKAYISCDVSSACSGTVTVSKAVGIGVLRPTIYEDEQPNCAWGTRSFYVVDFDGTNYEWLVDGSATLIYGQGGSYITVKLTGFYGYYSIDIRKTTPCGVSYVDPFDPPIEYSYGNCSSYRYSYYPNPAQNELTVSYIPEKGSAPGKQDGPGEKTFEVSLFDGKAKAWFSNIKARGEVKISTVELPDGTYFLHIRDGKEMIKRQVVIKH